MDLVMGPAYNAREGSSCRCADRYQDISPEVPHISYSVLILPFHLQYLGFVVSQDMYSHTLGTCNMHEKRR